MTALWKLRSAIAGLVGAHMPTASKVSTGATALLKAEHRSLGGNVHPHEWEVTAVCRETSDAMILRYSLNCFLDQWQGKCLPDELMRGEQLARAVMLYLQNEGYDCFRVEVRRHAEGIYAEAQS